MVSLGERRQKRVMREEGKKMVSISCDSANLLSPTCLSLNQLQTAQTVTSARQLTLPQTSQEPLSPGSAVSANWWPPRRPPVLCVLHLSLKPSFLLSLFQG